MAPNYSLTVLAFVATGLGYFPFVIEGSRGLISSRDGEVDGPRRVNKQANILDLGAPADSGVWAFSNANGSISATAAVPGGIYTDLLRAGVIGDPYYGFNDYELKWVGRDDWTYKRTFTVDVEVLSAQEVLLVFDGLDTVATVLVNGIVVGSSDNMFVRYVFPVKDSLQEGENELTVEFRSPVLWAEDQANDHISTYGYEILPGCVAYEYQGECHVNMMRKMQASFSWDWGPSFPSVGIWKSVRLESFDGAVLRDVKVSMTPADISNLDNSDWNVEISAYLQASSSSPQNGVLAWSLGELSVDGSSSVQGVEPSENSEFVVTANFVVPANSGVKLWWPNGYGNQNLYNLDVSYQDSASGEVSQSKPLRIGFRTLRLVQEEIPDARGLTFEFEVNKVRMFSKGSNWIPADVLPERVTPDYLRDLLDSVKAANQNMMRVWGGGIYEADEFYDIADEMGILIWQDFMFACAMYPVTPEYLDSVRQEVRTQVRRLHHHPSLALWAGNNENEAALKGNWYGTDANYDLYKGDYIKLYVDVVREEVRREDPSRDFVLSSPSNGVETDEEGFVADNPYSWEYGDLHHYDYNSESWNWRIYPRPRFISEYGFQSWSSFQALSSVYPPDQLRWSSDLMNHRQHHYNGQNELRSQVERYMVTPNDLDSPEGFRFFLYQIHVHQSMAVKAETEYVRRAMSSIMDWAYGRTMGALYWQTNEIWPGASWASLEYGGRWKMLHYYSKNFFAPLLISPFLTQENEVDVYIVSDLVEDVYGLKLEATLFNLGTGEIVRRETADVYARAQYAGSVWKQPLHKLVNGTEKVNVDQVYYFRLLDGSGNQVTEPNFVFLGDFLQDVPFADVELASVTGTAPDFDVEITSDLPALFVYLEADDIPGYFSDNGFLFFPGTTDRVVRFHSKDPSVSAEQLGDAIRITSLADNPNYRK